MDPLVLTELTTAFAPGQFLDIFMDLAPFIVSVIGILVAVAIVRGGVKKITGRLSKGAA